MGMQNLNTDDMSKKLEDMLPIIQQVNAQFKDPVSHRLQVVLAFRSTFIIKYIQFNYNFELNWMYFNNNTKTVVYTDL